MRSALARASRITAAVLLLIPTRVRGQSTPNEEGTHKGWGHVAAGGLGAWVGFAPGTTALFGGDTEGGRRTILLGIRWTRPLKGSLAFVADAVPLELALRSIGERDPVTSSERRVTVYGFGIEPVGLQWRARTGAVRPSVAALGGVRLFSEPYPTPGATRFNFVFDLEAAVKVAVSSRLTLSPGVQFHHVSNGGLGDSNPSLNQFVLAVGVYVRQ